MKMKKDEKNAVKEHIIKTAGFDNTTKGYQAITLLFETNEWDFWMLSETNLYRDLGIWLQKIGLKVTIRTDKAFVDDYDIELYYKNVMRMSPEPTEPEQSYCARYGIMKKKD